MRYARKPHAGSVFGNGFAIQSPSVASFAGELTLWLIARKRESATWLEAASRLMWPRFAREGDRRIAMPQPEDDETPVSEVYLEDKVMKFIELRSEDGGEYFCVNLDAIAYTRDNKSNAGDVEIFLKGGFNITAYVVGKDVDILRDAMGLRPLSTRKT